MKCSEDFRTLRTSEISPPSSKKKKEKEKEIGRNDPG